MISLKVKLKDANEIQDFVWKCNQLNCDADIIAGRYTVDAKSILGIFSVDLSKSLKLIVYTEDSNLVYDTMREYIVA